MWLFQVVKKVTQRGKTWTLREREWERMWERKKTNQGYKNSCLKGYVDGNTGDIFNPHDHSYVSWIEKNCTQLIPVVAKGSNIKNKRPYCLDILLMCLLVIQVSAVCGSPICLETETLIDVFTKNMTPRKHYGDMLCFSSVVFFFLFFFNWTPWPQLGIHWVEFFPA